MGLFKTWLHSNFRMTCSWHSHGDFVASAMKVSVVNLCCVYNTSKVCDVNRYGVTGDSLLAD